MRARTASTLAATPEIDADIRRWYAFIDLAQLADYLICTYEVLADMTTAAVTLWLALRACELGLADGRLAVPA